MKKTIVYIGYAERWINGKMEICVALSQNPKEFTGEYHKITAAYGDGSCGCWFIKLKKRLETKNDN